jgi:hypothetical protein
MQRSPRTREAQYNAGFDIVEKYGMRQLRLTTNATWNRDPKQVLFTMVHYLIAVCCGKKVI